MPICLVGRFVCLSGLVWSGLVCLNVWSYCLVGLYILPSLCVSESDLSVCLPDCYVYLSLCPLSVSVSALSVSVSALSGLSVFPVTLNYSIT